MEIYSIETFRFTFIRLVCLVSSSVIEFYKEKSLFFWRTFVTMQFNYQLQMISTVMSDDEEVQLF